MWKCHKCGKPVYFAERKQSLGYDWHPECLRCQECDKRLNPGQHAEHKGEPYCYTPCYSVLFGPTLYGHGSQVETHTSFGKCEKIWPAGVDRAVLEAKLKVYNNYYDGNSGQLKWKERNSQLTLEGQLHIYWGVDNLIHLKENDDQRHHVQLRKRYSCRETFYKQRNATSANLDHNDNIGNSIQQDASRVQSLCDVGDKESTINDFGSDSRLEGAADHAIVNSSPIETDSLKSEDHKRDMKDGVPTEITSINTPALSQGEHVTNGSSNLQENDILNNGANSENEEINPQRERRQTKSVDLSHVQIRKLTSSRSKTRLKRRCSINGHYYNRETKIFTPPKGSASNVWISSMVTTKVVINLLLDKFRIENDPGDFALYVVRDNGECRRIKDDDYPLLTRILLGPHEQVAKVFIMDRKHTNEISNEVAQYLNFQEPELLAILQKFDEEEANERIRIKLKFDEMRRRISTRLDEMQHF